MKTVKIPKQIYYKQAIFLQPSTLTLQVLLKRALKKLNVQNRHETIIEAGPDQPGAATSTQKWLRFINSPRESGGCQFGVMVLYSPSIHHLVVNTALDQANDELDVSKMSPPEGKQFMETPLYFAVRDNHLVLLQSKVLRVDALELHLNWLLTQAGGIDADQRIDLSDAIPEETRKKLEKSAVNRITFRAPFFESAAVPIGDSDDGKFSKAMKVATGMGLEMLKSILPKNQYSALKVEEMTDIPDIQVNLEIKVVGRKKPQHSDNKVMRTIMHSLRHVEDADFVHAEIEGIGTVKGQSMRVHDHKSFESIDGVLVTADVFEVMRKWLETLVDKGTVRVDS